MQIRAVARVYVCAARNRDWAIDRYRIERRFKPLDLAPKYLSLQRNAITFRVPIPLIRGRWLLLRALRSVAISSMRILPSLDVTPPSQTSIEELIIYNVREMIERSLDFVVDRDNGFAVCALLGWIVLLQRYRD